MQLYVARDRARPERHDVGSVLCLRVLDLLPPGTVSVREARSGEPRPPWLTGTPTLVIDGHVLRGFEAISHLQRLAVDLARRPKEQRQAPSRQTPREEEEEEEEDWTAAMTASMEDEVVDTDRKLTGDDLARAMRAREQPKQQPGGKQPPPPPPMKD